MIINITVSVAAIMLMGICGAIIGTIAALAYRSIVTIYFSNKKVLERSPMKTYKHWIINGAVFVAIMVIFFVDTFSNMSFLKLLLNGVIHSIWIVALYFLVNFVFNKETFKAALELYREKKG